MMKKLIDLIFKPILGFVLFIVAYLLFFPLSIINFFIVAIKNRGAKGYFLNSAINLDRYANREFRTLWNTLMRKPQGYPFGVESETISSALGKNKRRNTLSIPGRILCVILSFLDKNHCEKSIVIFKT